MSVFQFTIVGKHLSMTDGERDRRTAFEAIVLHGIWVLISLAWGRKPHDGTSWWRSHALSYMDEHGLQSEEAKTCRREKTFPEIYTWQGPHHNG